MPVVGVYYAVCSCNFGNLSVIQSSGVQGNEIDVTRGRGRCPLFLMLPIRCTVIELVTLCECEFYVMYFSF